jgi:hypothetical protein
MAGEHDGDGDADDTSNDAGLTGKRIGPELTTGITGARKDPKKKVGEEEHGAASPPEVDGDDDADDDDHVVDVDADGDTEDEDEDDAFVVSLEEARLPGVPEALLLLLVVLVGWCCFVLFLVLLRRFVMMDECGKEEEEEEEVSLNWDARSLLLH